MTSENISDVTRVIENIQKLVEQNQKDYTNAKFKELQGLFEQLKTVVASEIEHSIDINKEKSRFSSAEFKQLSEKVSIFSDAYNHRLTSLEKDSVTIEKVENIVTKRSEKRWAERAVYVIFILGLLVTGYGTFNSLKGSFDTHIQITNQHEQADEKRFDKIEADAKEYDRITTETLKALKQKQEQITADIIKLRGLHGL